MTHSAPGGQSPIVDKELFGRQVTPELGLQGVVVKTGEQLLQHGGRNGIAATIVFLAADEKERLGDVAFSCTGVAGKDQSLLARCEFEARKLHDLTLVYTGLENEVVVRKELQLRKFRFLDTSLDTA